VTTENAVLLTNAATRCFVAGFVVQGGVLVVFTDLSTRAVGPGSLVAGTSKGGVSGAVLRTFTVALIESAGRAAIKLRYSFGS